MSKNPIADFDRRAEEYDHWFDEHPQAYRSELDAVRSALPLGGVGVEIGAGTGRFMLPIHIPTGVEPSRKMGAIARARGAQIVRARAEKLPFRDASFHFALQVNVVCFVSDPACVLGEVRRILRPGGHVVLAVIDRETPLEAKYVEGKDSSPFYRHARFYSAQELTGLLLTAGFENLTYRQTIFLDPDEMTAPDPVREGYGAGAFR